MKNPKIGAHVSIAGGINKAIKRAIEIGAECIQIFPGSPRRYDVFSLNEKDVINFSNTVQNNNITPIFIHASYLINLASEDINIKQKSVRALIESLFFAEKIKANGLIYHPGSPKGGSKENAIEREIKSLQEILNRTPKKTNIYIENTAGIKKIGTNEKEIGYIVKKINSSRMSVCIDTAHALESGNIQSFSKTEIKEWITKWKNEVGLKKIGVFHINDSLTAFNSHHDRHQNIGEGFIGMQGFCNLMSFDDIRNIPWIIEVPGFDNLGPDKKNIDILKKLRSNFNDKND